MLMALFEVNDCMKERVYGGFNDVVIIARCPTPIGKFQGSRSGLGVHNWGAIAVREGVKRTSSQWHQVNKRIMGNIMAPRLGQNPARRTSLFGGGATEVGAMTINKVCGSGLKTIALTARACWSRWSARCGATCSVELRRLCLGDGNAVVVER
jgi:acetyl-CoA acetyltransferase